jgi:hypothetical protein
LFILHPLEAFPIPTINPKNKPFKIERKLTGSYFYKKSLPKFQAKKVQKRKGENWPQIKKILLNENECKNIIHQNI